jgi:LPS sulfotransferase NodH
MLKGFSDAIQSKSKRTFYFICATPRSGSYLLCEALTGTGLAGCPEEYIQPCDFERRIAKYNASTFKEYIEALLRVRTTPNGVFGMKLMYPHFEDIITEICAHSANFTGSSHEILNAFFPNLRYIWVTRLDKVRQSVSYSRALQTGIWAQHGDRLYVPLQEPKFDKKTIDCLLQKIAHDEDNWAAYFSSCNIEPFRVVYEDFVNAYERTAVSILEYLSISVPADLVFAKRRMRKQADKLSEEWVQFYRETKGLV